MCVSPTSINTKLYGTGHWVLYGYLKEVGICLIV